MFSKPITALSRRSLKKERERLRAIDWRPVVEEVRPYIEDHSILLETRFDGFVPIEDIETDDTERDVVAVAVALVRPDMAPWETEEPARAMSEKLQERLGRRVPRLVSRHFQSWAGHYVRVDA